MLQKYLFYFLFMNFKCMNNNKGIVRNANAQEMKPYVMAIL